MDKIHADVLASPAVSLPNTEAASAGLEVKAAEAAEFHKTFTHAYLLNHIEPNYEGGENPNILIFWRARFHLGGEDLYFAEKPVRNVMHRMGFVLGSYNREFGYLLKRPKAMIGVPRRELIDEIMNLGDDGLFHPAILLNRSRTFDHPSREYAKISLFVELKEKYKLGKD